jgi:glucuronate isomerase
MKNEKFVAVLGDEIKTFDKLKDAIRFANEHFKETGHLLGIEREETIKEARAKYLFTSKQHAKKLMTFTHDFARASTDEQKAKLIREIHTTAERLSELLRLLEKYS